MIYTKYNPTDNRYIFLYDDTKSQVHIRTIEKYFNKIPKYMFLPSYSGIPKPEVFLHKFVKDGKNVYWCHSGLWHEIITFCKSNNIPIDENLNNKSFKYTNFNINKNEFKEWVNSLGLDIKPREYQIEAAWMILKYRQSMSQLATRSGKTLIAYIVFRWLRTFAGVHNILMIVPNTSLVKQGVNDFKEYGDFFNTETVWAKSELCDSSDITIGTFQSLVNRLNKKSKSYDPKFFNKFDVVLVDECHKLKCKSIDNILSQDFMKNLKLRFGFSGTIPENGTIENFCCQSLMGPIIQDISTKELIDSGYLSNVDIEQIYIKYDNDDSLKEQYIKCGEYICSNYVLENGNKILLPKEDRLFLIRHVKQLPFSLKAIKNKVPTDEYINYIIDLCKSKGSNLLMLEQMITFLREERIELIRNIINKSSKNFIIFGHHKEYLNYIYKEIKNSTNKECFIITGNIPIKQREHIMKYMDSNDNCVLFASYSCVGTGLTFKNIDFGIFIESFKSQIVNKQSLGRGLLLAPGKESFKLYDIIDCLPSGRLKIHGKHKNNLFSQEGFTVSKTFI